MAESPAAWDAIKRNPQLQQKLVNHFVIKAVPEKARRMMEQEKLRNEPFSENELWKAIEEARQKIEDPQKREKVVAELRAKIWELKYPQRKKAG